MVHVSNDGILSSDFEERSIPLSNLIAVYNQNHLQRRNFVNSNQDGEDPFTAILLNDLSPDVQESDLFPLFGHALSRIVDIQIARDAQSRRGLGYAHVIFEFAAAADSALRALGGDGSLVRVGTKGTAKVTKSKTAISSLLDEFNLYMGKLPSNVTHEDIETYLKDLWAMQIDRNQSNIDFIAKQVLDPPKSETVPNEPQRPMELREIRLENPPPTSGEIIRYALISIKENRDAMRILDAYHVLHEKDDGRLIKGLYPLLAELSPRPQSSDKPGGDTLTLGVQGLLDHVTGAELHKLFSRYGVIEALKFYPMKHMAFVKYAKIAAAIAAKCELSGHPLKGVPIRVQWTHADPSLFSEGDFQPPNSPAGTAVALSSSVFGSRRREEFEIMCRRLELEPATNQPKGGVEEEVAGREEKSQGEEAHRQKFVEEIVKVARQAAGH